MCSRAQGSDCCPEQGKVRFQWQNRLSQDSGHALRNSNDAVGSKAELASSRSITVGGANHPRNGEFYLLKPDVFSGGRGHGVAFDNAGSLPLPGYLDWTSERAGLASMKEIPRLRFDDSAGELPYDLEGGFKGYWLVSQALKDIFESVDRTGFSFLKCEFVLEDGSGGPPHYLCEVTRMLDAIDEAASTVKVLTEGYPHGKFYSTVGGARFAMRKDVVGDAHVFRTPYTADVFCDRVMHDALIKSGFSRPPTTCGVCLIDAADV